MIELPRVYTHSVSVSNTPKQVGQSHRVPEKPPQQGHQERRKQSNRRRMSGTKTAIERRLPTDRRRPAFEAKV